jgi:hypothetical protein
MIEVPKSDSRDFAVLRMLVVKFISGLEVSISTFRVPPGSTRINGPLLVASVELTNSRSGPLSSTVPPGGTTNRLPLMVKLLGSMKTSGWVVRPVRVPATTRALERIDRLESMTSTKGPVMAEL